MMSGVCRSVVEEGGARTDGDEASGCGFGDGGEISDVGEVGEGGKSGEGGDGGKVARWWRW